MQPQGDIKTVPFESVEDAWLWFIQAQQARDEGARIVAGMSLYPRPCEPIDILKVVDRLYRQRKLIRDHLLVLRHYGRRQMAPDPRRMKERRGYMLWREAMDAIGPVLEKKGIIQNRICESEESWHSELSFLNFGEGMAVE